MPYFLRLNSVFGQCERFIFVAFLCLVTSQGFALELRLDREDLHEWEKYVRGFRREHHFTWVAGYSDSTWEVYRLGSLEDRKFHRDGIYGKFQYSFHLPIHDGFGYALGSSFGSMIESRRNKAAAADDDFKSVPSIMFPGVLAGLVMNFSPAWRFGVFGEVYLERFDGLREQDEVDEDTEIHITTESFDGSIALDWFMALKWAIRLEGHQRRLLYVRPQAPEGKPVDANIKKREQWYGAGLVYHFL